MPQSSIDPIVARNLRTALDRRGRSAYSVANALGHPSNWLYQVLREKSGLLVPSLREIAEELGISVGSLVDTESIPGMNKQPSPDTSIAGQRLAAARMTAGKTPKRTGNCTGIPIQPADDFGSRERMGKSSPRQGGPRRTGAQGLYRLPSRANRGSHPLCRRKPNDHISQHQTHPRPDRPDRNTPG